MAHSFDEDYCHTCKAWIRAVLKTDLSEPAYVCPRCDKILFELAIEIQRYLESRKSTRAVNKPDKSLFERP